MEAIFSWVKNIICCLCMLELLYHIVQNAEYRKYLRFFGGIIFILLTMEPILNVFELQSSFEEALCVSLRQEDARELSEAADSLAELRSEKIYEAYEKELKRQIGAIVEGHGGHYSKLEIRLEEENSVWSLEGIEIILSGSRDEGIEEAIEGICAEISAVYGIARGEISVSFKE